MKSHREYVNERIARSPRLKRALAEARIEARLAVLLSRLREQRGWTQRQLSEATGIRQPQIARIESGGHLPSLETLRKLADALNATVTIGPRNQLSVEARPAAGSRR
jgi:transcriptional regulator with XRE-family HTH domain